MRTPTLETERLVLREWREVDREPFAQLNADPRAMEYLGAPLSRAQSDEFIDRIVEHFETHGYGLWAVEVAGSSPFIGYVGLSVQTFESSFTPCTEIGWRLMPESWGNGFATEAAIATLAYGFTHADLDEIQSWTVPMNTRSRAVMERLGMTRDEADDFDHPRLLAGDPLRRHVRYRLHRPKWEQGA
jgi:ribosomal-protein-alanine N-acetyltransferase